MSVLVTQTFEAGGITGFSNSSAPTPAAGGAIHGNYGILFDTAGGDQSIRYDDSSTKARMRTRFVIDTTNVSLANGAGIRLIIHRNNAWGYLGHIELRKNATGYHFITAGIYKDDTITVEGAIVYRPLGIHTIEADYSLATAPGANDGYVKLFVDGVLVDTITGIDNDSQALKRVDFGVRDMWGTVSGTMKMDSVTITTGEVIGYANPSPFATNLPTLT